MVVRSYKAAVDASNWFFVLNPCSIQAVGFIIIIIIIIIIITIIIIIIIIIIIV